MPLYMITVVVACGPVPAPQALVQLPMSPPVPLHPLNPLQPVRPLMLHLPCLPLHEPDLGQHLTQAKNNKTKHFRCFNIWVCMYASAHMQAHLTIIIIIWVCRYASALMQANITIIIIWYGYKWLLISKQLRWLAIAKDCIKVIWPWHCEAGFLRLTVSQKNKWKFASCFEPTQTTN